MALSVLLHFSFALPFIVIALPVLHFAKEQPSEQESKAPSSLEPFEAMTVDILTFSEKDPEALAPSKFLGIDGTRQTLAFEEEAPDSVPKIDLVESTEPAKTAEEETAIKEGSAEAPPEPTEREPTEREVTEREVTEREMTEREMTEREPTEREPTEREMTEREMTERAPTEREPTEREPTEREMTEREMTEREVTEREPTEREPTEREPTEREMTEREMTEREMTEREMTERARADTKQIEQPPSASEGPILKETKIGDTPTQQKIPPPQPDLVKAALPPAAPVPEAAGVEEAMTGKETGLATQTTAIAKPTRTAAPTPGTEEATASNPDPAREAITHLQPVATSPDAAHRRSGKTGNAQGRLGELLQAMREGDQRLDRALGDTPDAKLGHAQIQSLRLQDAAAQGYAHAQYGLAEILMRGNSKEIPEEAKTLLTSAARSGYAEAQVLLGYLAASGKYEKQDFAEALSWLKLAGEHGNKAARYGAKALEKLMKVEDIIKAHRRAQRYRHFAASSAPTAVGIDDDRPPDEILRDASAKGNAELAQLMLARGADPNALDDSGRSALINAAWRGRKKTVALLLEKGADLTIRDNEGLSAVNWAAINGHPDTLRLLGKAGADMDERDNDNLTPLMRAAWNGHTNAVIALLKQGANPKLRTPSGKTALHYAQKEGYEQIQKLLQEAEKP